ncbi:MAG: lamin tail domain-containing protein [Patescibacteria group bacterium]
MLIMREINYFLIFVFLFLPVFAFADIKITEIMYNALGSGSSELQDFVEVKNIGSLSVDLSSFKFSDGSDHSINSYETSLTIVPPQEVVILVSSPSKFLTEWPQFSGKVLDSSVSFVTTDTAVIKDESGAIIDSVSFSSDMGANNDGNSLQLVNGQWIATIPTPGQSNATGELSGSQNLSNTNNSSPENQSQTQTTGTQLSQIYEQQIYANAGVDKTILVGAELLLNGSALGIKKEPLTNARYLWNFGDGSSKEGKKVSHTYSFPGIYTVSLDVSSGDYSQGDVMIVTAVDAKIKIGEIINGIDGYITVSNEGNSDIDISRFILQSSTSTFVFPVGTIIKAKNSIRFPNANTKLSGIFPVSLLYPNMTPVKAIRETVVPETSLVSQKSPILSSKKESLTPIQENSVSEENDKKDFLSAVGESGQENNLLWISAVLALVGISIAGVIYSRRERNEADLYEITEVDE